MRKSLKRVQDRLRTAAEKFRTPASVRGDLQLSQRMQALSASARTRPAR